MTDPAPSNPSIFIHALHDHTLNPRDGHDLIQINSINTTATVPKLQPRLVGFFGVDVSDKSMYYAVGAQVSPYYI